MTAQQNRFVAALAHHLRRDEAERDQREHAGDGRAAIQRVHDLAAFARLHEERADDRGDDRDRAEHQRIQHVAHVEAAVGCREQQAAEHHRRDDRDRVGLEQVGRHAGAVADVVADVVGDHRRVARIVFGNAGFDLADEIGADVGALGEDAAAETREDRDQRAAEGEADQRVQRVASPTTAQQREVAGDADQAEADDQHAGDGAAAERDCERRIEADAGGLRRAHVGAHRDVHADEAGEAREDGADREAAGGLPVEREAEHDEQHDADDGDRRVLAIEVRLARRPGWRRRFPACARCRRAAC